MSERYEMGRAVAQLARPDWRKYAEPISAVAYTDQRCSNAGAAPGARMKVNWPWTCRTPRGASGETVSFEFSGQRYRISRITVTFAKGTPEMRTPAEVHVILRDANRTTWPIMQADAKPDGTLTITNETPMNLSARGVDIVVKKLGGPNTGAAVSIAKVELTGAVCGRADAPSGMCSPDEWPWR